MSVIVKELMDASPTTMLQSDSARNLVALIEQEKRVIVINEYGAPVGIITPTSMLKLVDINSLNDPVRNIMDTGFRVLFPGDLIDNCHMKNQEIWPVVLNNRLIGAIDSQILLNYYKDEDEEITCSFNQVVMYLYNPVILFNKEGYITFFNKMAEEMIGIKADQAVGSIITNIVPQIELLNGLTDDKFKQLKFSIAHNTFIINRSSIHNKKGSTIGFSAVFHDISVRECLSSDLQLSKEYNEELESIINACSDGIYISDGKGVGIKVNKAYELMTGITNDIAEGKHLTDAIKEGYVNESVTLQVIEEKRAKTIRQKIRGNKDVLVTGNPIKDRKGEIIRVVTTVRDITEINRLNNEIIEIKEKNEEYLSEINLLREQQLRIGDDVVAKSISMRNIVRTSLQVAKFESTCLLLGESGVGKDVVARLIHSSSPRSAHKFIKLNCGAIPKDLLEAELFGYETGAFSGARKGGKPGMFQLANNGTIFLDEIGELPLELQVKLLQVIQDREVIRIGGTESIELDVRIIAATNRNLEKMVKSGLFRKDLYYRLNIVPIAIPPLRERQEDIIPLIELYLAKINDKYKKNSYFSPEVLNRLLNYNWPGNIRELKNIIERMVVVSPYEMLTIEYLPNQIIEAENKIFIEKITSNKIKDATQELEKHLIIKAIRKNKSLRKSAEYLGVNESTISRKVKKYNITL